MSRRRKSSVQSIHSVRDGTGGRRRRRTSTVQSIALNIPLIDKPLELEVGLDHKYSTRPRSKSLSANLGSEDGEEEPQMSQEETLLYPFTGKERVDLWNTEINKFESDLSVDPDDLLRLEELSLEDAFEFQEYLKYTLSENKQMGKRAEETVERLDELLTVCDQVTSETADFQAKSNELIVEVEKLGQLEGDLTEKLSYFEALDPIVKLLNTSSSGSIVTKRDFQENVLGKLDYCLQFLNDPANADYKEVEVYRSRFKQCMVRALTLVRNYVNVKVRQVEDNIQAKIDKQKEQDSDLSSATSRVLVEAILYEKFPDDLTSMTNLFQQLYTRCVVNQDESDADQYMGLLDDCYNQYFKSRGNLLSNLMKPYEEAFNNSASVSQGVQLVLSKFSKLLEKEAVTFQRVFFLTPDQIDASKKIDNVVNIAAMNRFFETLAEPLYDSIRDRIIRENNVGVLCETIGIIESYFEYEDDSASVTSAVDARVRGLIDYAKLLKPVLEDAQTRLVFRVRRYIDQNVVNYRRTGKELTIGNRKNSSTEQDDPDLDTASLVSASTTDIVSMPAWESTTAKVYPPVKKSVKLLSKIYQLVGQNVFDDLANSIVHMTVQSLKETFDQDVSLESKLYQIKNLMYLKDYMAAFDIEGSSKETSLDFSGLKNLYQTIFRRRDQEGSDDQLSDTLLLPDGSSQFQSEPSSSNPFFAAMPRVKTDFFNCKLEIQATLRDAVHSFSNTSKQVFTQPLQDYPDNADLATTVDKFMDTLHKELPLLGPRIESYIHDRQTMFYLIDGIQNDVMEQYEQFYQRASEQEKSDQVEALLDPEAVLGEWGTIVTDMLEEMSDDDEPVIDETSEAPSVSLNSYAPSSTAV